MKYGPQTEKIEALIERVKTLTPNQAQELADFQNTVWNIASKDVWTKAWNASWDAALKDWGNSWDALWDSAWEMASDNVWDAAWNSARDTVWGAIMALVVQDLISEEDFNTLYGPWASVMES